MKFTHTTCLLSKFRLYDVISHAILEGLKAFYVTRQRFVHVHSLSLWLPDWRPISLPLGTALFEISMAVGFNVLNHKLSVTVEGWIA